MSRLIERQITASVATNKDAFFSERNANYQNYEISPRTAGTNNGSCYDFPIASFTSTCIKNAPLLFSFLFQLLCRMKINLSTSSCFRIKCASGISFESISFDMKKGFVKATWLQEKTRCVSCDVLHVSRAIFRQHTKIPWNNHKRIKELFTLSREHRLGIILHGREIELESEWFWLRWFGERGCDELYGELSRDNVINLGDFLDFSLPKYFRQCRKEWKMFSAPKLFLYDSLPFREKNSSNKKNYKSATLSN